MVGHHGHKVESSRTHGPLRAPAPCFPEFLHQPQVNIAEIVHQDITLAFTELLHLPAGHEWKHWKSGHLIVKMISRTTAVCERPFLKGTLQG